MISFFVGYMIGAAVGVVVTAWNWHRSEKRRDAEGSTEWSRGYLAAVIDLRIQRATTTAASLIGGCDERPRLG